MNRFFTRTTLYFLGALAFAIAGGGCTGTAAAYREAGDLGETAYVLSEHYESLVTEAANLRDRSVLPIPILKAVQEADRAAKPVVLNLRTLRKAYLDVQNAQTQAELQKGIDDATKVIADMVRAVNVARGSRTSFLERRIDPGVSYATDQQRGARANYAAIGQFGPRAGWKARSLGEPF